jgi:hypothetical protein
VKPPPAMSRSHRKTPIIAFSGAESEKADKQGVHRQERHAVRQTLTERLSADAAKVPHRRSGRWVFAKDDRRWVGDPDPRRMRK